MPPSCPLISVIIPTHDRPALLLRAVGSVAHQTYPNVEVIVVNDGAQSGVREAIGTAFPDLRCRVIPNTRRSGAAGARNAGYVDSHGAYLAFLDDDDEWLPEKLTRQWQALSERDARVGVVCVWAVLVDGPVETLRRYAVDGAVHRQLCRETMAGNTSNPMIARWAFEAAGGFDERLPAAQDTDLWLRLAKHCHFVTVREPLVRVHVQYDARITRDVRKQLVGVFLLLWKHWTDLPLSRKSFLVKRLLQLVRSSACISRHGSRP